jgi:hypothetical protein
VSSLYFRFNAHGDGSAPLLSRLLSRAEPSSVVSDWRSQALGHDAPPAPLALFADQGGIDAAWVCFATPVHYTAEMSNVRLRQDGILRLDEPDARALAADFNRVWHDAGVSMVVGRFADLFFVFALSLQVTTHDPDQVLGHHIEEFLPTGPDAGRLRRLMSEIEMWLFERRSPALVNGLWLWGGGGALTSPQHANLKTAGDDVLFNYFHGDVSHGGIVSAPKPGSSAWPAAQSRWLEPAVAALKSGQLSELLISGADRCFRVRASNLWRFWRRDRPWNEHFQ